MKKKSTNYTHHTIGDGTKQGDMMKDILLQVCVERARQGYVNEIEYCEKNNIAF